MPFPRFTNLDPERRRRLLASAAQEFAVHGFEGAVLSRIMEAAGMSKAAMYYYFHDKSDLYAAAIEEAWRAFLPEEPLSLERLDAATFWPELLRYYLAMLAQAGREPWLAAAGKLVYHVAPESGASEIVAAQLAQARAVLERLVRRGQELGVVRRDLPEGLLVALATGAAEAADRWMVDAWETLSEAELEPMGLRLFEVLRTMASPPAAPVGPS
jgi:AcrR family transcriptional regulator